MYNMHSLTSLRRQQPLPPGHYLVHLLDVVRGDGEGAAGHIHDGAVVEVGREQILLHSGTH